MVEPRKSYAIISGVGLAILANSPPPTKVCSFANLSEQCYVRL
jgi:hypothetical protein